MTETAVGHLYKVSSVLNTACEDINKQHIKSYYLMRCHEITKSFGLPTRQFSAKKRCMHCCIEWNQGGYETTIKPITLSKRQRYKLRKRLKVNTSGQDSSKEDLLNSNQLERLCLLCNKTTVINLEKPERNEEKKVKLVPKEVKTNKQINKKLQYKTIENKPQTQTGKHKEINVYGNIKAAFSIKNQDNLLATSVTAQPKQIKNNKKKKDKFAGLCKEAVMSATKFKTEQDKKNKLNLFLKPSL